MATSAAVPGEPQGLADLVSQGVALIRVENESMLSIAAQRPRNEAKILESSLKELDLVPEHAVEAFYTIPYRERQPDGSTRMVNVQGPSIGAAMALARRWGNCSAAARIANEDKEGVDLDGVFIDLESNFRVSKPFRVSRWGKTRAGGAYMLDSQRLVMAVQAGASKALRNAILSGLPKYLVAAYYNKARQIAGGHPDVTADPKRVDAILKAFDRFKITREQLEAYTERKVADWTGEEVANLRGVWNVLQDKQATAEELFGAPTPEHAAPAAAVTAPGQVTPESIMAGAVTGQNNAPEPKRERPECAHPAVPPSKLAGGKVIVCPDCQEELRGEAPTREPGDDTEAEPTARQAVEAIAAKAGQAEQPRRGDFTRAGTQRRMPSE